MAGYIGSGASVVSSGVENKKVFDITTNTTSLTGLNYTVGKVHVYHNGVRLVDGTDYTAADSTSITLTVAAVSGDQVVVVSYASFQVSGAVSTSGDTMTGDLNVTGTVTSDGLTVDTDTYRRLLLTYPDAFTSKLQVGFSNFYVQGSATNDRLTIANNSSGQTHFENQSKTSMVIDNSGDISFYEDTGTTAKFFWDASAESLGIGTDSTSARLEVAGNSNSTYLIAGGDDSSNGRALTFTSSASANFNGSVHTINAPSSQGVIALSTAGTERMRLDASGRVTTPYQPAFNAYRASSYAANSAGDLKVTINTATLNVGNYYNAPNSRFTAPVAGVYTFDTTISVYHNTASSLQTQDDSQYLTFTVNGVELGRNSGKNAAMLNSGYLTKSGVELSTTFTAILSLNQGDYVEVEYGDIQSNVTISNASFSGYLIG